MDRNDILIDGIIGTIAGMVAGKVMSPATTKLYEYQTDEAKEQEEDASYGVAYNVAAKKSAGWVGLDMTDDQAAKAGNALHYGLALAWAPIYMWLRRSKNMTPFGAGLASGLSMYVLVDEGLNPLLGFTPPPNKYPLVSHLRGFAGHSVYGLALAGVVEAGWRLSGRRPTG